MIKSNNVKLYNINMRILELMNRDSVVCTLEYDEYLGGFTKTLSEINYDKAPFCVAHRKDSKAIADRKALNDWFKDRRIPDSRSTKKDHLNNELGRGWYGASLSDQYWFKENGSNIKYHDISFFHNAYEERSINDKTLLLNHPDNTTGGMVPKTWMKENGVDYLLKGSYFRYKQEPLSEVIASMLCKALEIPYVPYSLIERDGEILCSCPCMINEYEEMIPAYELFMAEKKSNNISDLRHYKNILRSLGINDFRTLDGMMLLDFIMKNQDRHMGNFGVIKDLRDNTYRITPIYDTGYSLGCNHHEYDRMYKEHAKFATTTNLPFNRLLNNIENLESFNLEKLHNTIKEVSELIDCWQEKVGLSNDRAAMIKHYLSVGTKEVLAYKKKN